MGLELPQVQVSHAHATEATTDSYKLGSVIHMVRGCQKSLQLLINQLQNPDVATYLGPDSHQQHAIPQQHVLYAHSSSNL